MIYKHTKATISVGGKVIARDVDADVTTDYFSFPKPEPEAGDIEKAIEFGNLAEIYSYKIEYLPTSEPSLENCKCPIINLGITHVEGCAANAKV